MPCASSPRSVVLVLALALAPSACIYVYGEFDSLDHQGETFGDETLGEEDGVATSTSEGDTGDDWGSEGATNACVGPDSLIAEAMVLDLPDDRILLLGPQGLRAVPLEPSPHDTWLIFYDYASSPELVVVAWSEFGAGTTWVHVIDRARAVLDWKIEVGTAVGPGLWVGDAGEIVGEVVLVDQPDAGVLLTDGEVTMLPRRPIAGPRQGIMPGREVKPNGEAAGAGWLTLATMTWQPTSLVTDSQPVRVSDDGLTLEYLRFASPALFRERPEGSEIFDLDGLAGLAGLAVVDEAGPFRLIRAHDVGMQNWTFVRLDVETGEQWVLDPEPPNEFTYFDCNERAAALDGDGALLFQLRNSSIAQLYAYDPVRASFTALGLPLGAPTQVWLDASVGSTHVLGSYDDNIPPCAVDPWEPAPPEALVDETLQVIRKTPAVASPIPQAEQVVDVKIDPSERCIAIGGGEGWRVRGVDDPVEVHVGPNQYTDWIWLE